MSTAEERRSQNSVLFNCTQRARLLANGVAGRLTERQQALAMDILRDLEQLLDANYAPEPEAEITRFSLLEVVREVSMRCAFLANRKTVRINLRVLETDCTICADRHFLVSQLVEVMRMAIEAAPSGGQVFFETCRSVDRVAFDVWTTGWDPKMKCVVPQGSNIAVSILRTAGGVRYEVSCPVA